MKTIGEFYKEKILSLSKDMLLFKELPLNRGDVRIENDLFGWKLFSSKHSVVCRSEEEARYLKIFLEANITEVYVPKDEGYLHSILDEIEKLKLRTDEIINSYLASITDRRIKERVRNEVLLEVAS